MGRPSGRWEQTEEWEIHCADVGGRGEHTLHFDTEVMTFHCVRKTSKTRAIGQRQGCTMLDMDTPLGYEYTQPKRQAPRVLFTLLCGTLDKNSPLRKLRGLTNTILKMIVDMSGADQDRGIWTIHDGLNHSTAPPNPHPHHPF
jgi:hypothetical protein